jgi:hypothetical protein
MKKETSSVANGNPTPIVAKNLLKSNMLGSYACIHTLYIPSHQHLPIFSFYGAPNNPYQKPLIKKTTRKQLKNA